MLELESVSINWNYPTAIRFGAGRIAELPDACRQAAISRPLLVTDSALASLPIVDEARAMCRTAGLTCAVFSDVQGNPIAANVTAGVAAYHAGGHDGVIAFGGGSGLDAGKAVALMSGQTRPLWDFEDRADWWTRVDEAGIAPLIAVPTTSGTGSEVGRASVITDVTDQTKKIIFHPRMLPSYVILDPRLTVSLPKKITAAVGMDALSHCLEAYCSPLYHPLAHGIALEGIKLVKDWLPTAVANGQNLTARAQMQVASTMGATAFQKGLGAMHGLSHPCGAVLNTHHGLTNAVVMPYVLQFNQQHIEPAITDLARYLNLPDPSFSAFLDWVIALRAELEIPHTLAEIGVNEDVIDQLAPMAVDDPSTATNPRPVDLDAATGLFRAAISGRL